MQTAPPILRDPMAASCLPSISQNRACKHHLNLSTSLYSHQYPSGLSLNECLASHGSHSCMALTGRWEYGELHYMAEISPTNLRPSSPKAADEAELSTPSLAMEAAKAARAAAEHAAQLTDEHWSSSGPMQARSRIYSEHVTEHVSCMDDMPVVGIALGYVMLSRACQTSLL